MRAPRKVLIGCGVLAGVALVVLILGRLGSKEPAPSTQTDPAEPSPPPLAETDNPSTGSQQPRQPASPLRINERPAAGAPASANLITNWEDKVDQILGAEGETEAKAKQMLEMFRLLPEDGQVEVARHLSNLVADEDYAPMRQLLTDPQLPEAVLDTLMADVLNRRNNLKLPALLEVARTAQHPKAANAQEVLGFFLETDYGDDWAKWDEKVQEWLKENPD